MEGTEELLSGDNRFTEEEVVFSLNQFMHQLAQGALLNWFRERRHDVGSVVGVRCEERTPTSGWLESVAVLLAGHRLQSALAPDSHPLLGAFLSSWAARASEVTYDLVTLEELFVGIDAVIATGDVEEQEALSDRAQQSGIASSHRLFRPCGVGIAVIDGEESEDEREELAEDCLVHGGRSCRSVRLLWAPRDLDPDPYFEALAAFRAVFPVHPDVPGTLQMNQAFLEAQDHPHAYGEGLEFLVSRGAPEVQQPGHLRWVEYDDLEAVEAWLRTQQSDLSVLAARQPLAHELKSDALNLPIVAPGEAHRQPFAEQREELVGFLNII